MPREDWNIRELLHNYAENKLSAQETAELFRYLDSHKEESEQLLLELAETYRDRFFNAEPLPEVVSDRMKHSILSQINPTPVIQIEKVRPANRIRWAAVAAILLLLCTTAYLMMERQKVDHPVNRMANLQHTKTDALPGYDGAILTIGNGNQIILDSASNGIVTREENTHVVKKGNQLIYDKPAEPLAVSESFNTLSTLKGRKFQLVLADGTKVWLDAASSLTYPITFSGNQRRVRASGQLYFEVAKDTARPFVVEAGGTTVQVLGTHFNINAYEDETTMKTTLLEGSVKISGKDESQVLKPGQQAVVSGSGIGKVSVNNDVDIDAVMAWRRGLFQFTNADLTTVLRQLARWYDMEIVYEGTIPARKFEGKIGRDLNLSQVLKLLEKVQVRFRIEGNRLIVQA